MDKKIYLFQKYLKAFNGGAYSLLNNAHDDNEGVEYAQGYVNAADEIYNFFFKLFEEEFVK